jgi:hypothetical protein
MELKSGCMHEAPEFLCPFCGASAFEIVDKQRNPSLDGEREEFLVLRCLACLEVFHHQLGRVDPAQLPAQPLRG